MESKFLTVREVAEMLKVNKMTIYRYVKAGKIEAYKVGKDFRIQETEIEKFLENIKVSRVSNDNK